MSLWFQLTLMSLNCDDVDNGSENGVEFYLFLPGFAAGRHATYDWSVVGPINKSRSLPVDCRLFFYFRFLAPPPRSIAVASRFTGFFLGFTWFSSSKIGLDYNLDLISSINEFECMTNEKPQSRRDDNQWMDQIDGRWLRTIFSVWSWTCFFVDFC